MAHPTDNDRNDAAPFSIEFGRTNRGFDYAEFDDLYGAGCSIQKSSLAFTEAIWFGLRECPDDVDGHPIAPRMHLSQEQVAVLLPILQRFVETGELT